MDPKERIAQIDKEISTLNVKIRKYNTIQQALKILINSIYGAFGNKYFYFYNKDIAASITLQGQDLIKFSIRTINYYFNNIWHKDTDIHEKMDITDYDIDPIVDPSAIYCDTDSTYVNMNNMLSSIKGLSLDEDKSLQFCIDFIDKRFQSFLDRAFEKYSLKYNTENRQRFKLETISRRGIWVAKKNYVLEPVYDGESKILLTSGKIKPTGIDAAKPSNPKYAREKLNPIISRLLEEGPSVDIEGYIIPLLEKYKKAFKLLTIDECSPTQAIRTYNKYVMDDRVLDIPKGMPIGARAALYHNFLLEKNDIRKYNKIQEGNQTKIYRAKDLRPGYEAMDIFAYIPGQHPKEIAPKIDWDQQFFDVMVEPINKLLNAMGLQMISPKLTRDVKFTKLKSHSSKKEEDHFPLRAVDIKNEDYVVIPKSINKYFGTLDEDMDTSKMSASDRSNYLEYAAMYGVNTAIVPDYQFVSYMKNLKKKNAKDRIKKMGIKELKVAYPFLSKMAKKYEKSLHDCEIQSNEYKEMLIDARSDKDKDLVAGITDMQKRHKAFTKEVKDNLSYWKDVLKKSQDTIIKLRKESE